MKISISLKNSLVKIDLQVRDNKMIITIDDENVSKRLDKVVSEMFPDISRSFIKKMIEEGEITVNDKKVKAGYSLKKNDELSVVIKEPEEVNILPEDIDLDIIYEDDDIIVINKPKDMVVHPAPGHYSHTLVNALMFHCKDSLSGINGELRPGIVHRIDKDTTGVLVACKNDNAHKALSEQLKVHSITRKYYAICYGSLKEDGTIETTIGRSLNDRKKMAVNVKGGREAITHYKVLDNLNNRFTYVECQLETGRTHQIRVSMASIGHPILGDEVYGPKKNTLNVNLQGQVLHAGVLGFIHPRTNEYMEFTAPLPEYFNNLLQRLKK